MKNQTFLTLPDDDGHQICPNCNSHMRYKYGGIFVCDKCGTETTNDLVRLKNIWTSMVQPMPLIWLSRRGSLPLRFPHIFAKESWKFRKILLSFYIVRDVAHRSALENTVPDVPNPPISKVLISATSQKATKPKSAS